MEQISTKQLLEGPKPKLMDAPKEDYDPVGSLHSSRLLAGPMDRWRGAHRRAGLLTGPVAHGGPTLEQSVPEGLYIMERTCSGPVLEELQPVGRTHVGEVHEELSPMGGTPHWSRGRVQRKEHRSQVL